MRDLVSRGNPRAFLLEIMQKQRTINRMSHPVNQNCSLQMVVSPNSALFNDFCYAIRQM